MLGITPTNLFLTTAGQQRQIALFWLVFLTVFGAVIFGLVWFASRWRNPILTRLDCLRRVGVDAMLLTDIAVADIEQTLASGATMDPHSHREYDEALNLRKRALATIDSATSSEALAQANQDAAQAVLALQRILRRLNIHSSLAGPHDVVIPRCFYCASQDQLPFTEKAIEDGRGNALSVQLCSACHAQLARGRTPQLATAWYSQATVPWFAIPGEPCYHAYGGPSWQYWLPFYVGVDIAGWFEGGWKYATTWQNPERFRSVRAPDQLAIPERDVHGEAAGSEFS